MLVSDKEARNKYCAQGADFRDFYCVGERCMKWRWFDGEDGQPKYKLSSENKWIITHYNPRRGYCGLAGLPWEGVM